MNKSFNDSEHWGQSNFDKFKKGSKEHEFHYDPKEQITTVYMKKNGKHISTYNHRTGEIYRDKHVNNESVELLDTISRGDTIKSTEKFSSALMSRVFSLIEQRRHEVAQNIFESTQKETVKVAVGTRPKGIGWSLHRSGTQHNQPHDIYRRITKESMLHGHPYHNKTEAELQYIMKDAAEAAKNMKGHDSKSEAKYLDQVNDASTILNLRKRVGSNQK